MPFYKTLITTIIFLSLQAGVLQTSAMKEMTLPNNPKPNQATSKQNLATSTNLQFSKESNQTQTTTQNPQTSGTNLKLTKLTLRTNNSAPTVESTSSNNGNKFKLEIIGRYQPSGVIATFEPFVEDPLVDKSKPEPLPKAENYSITQILNSTLPSGAIAKYPTITNIDNKINPYFSNLAVCGLATEGAFGNNAKKQEIITKAWQALDWYKSHQNPTTGFVSDYSVINGVETSLNNMDSVDSYVATYFLALQCMHKATGDTTKLKTYQSSMRVAFDSLSPVKDPIDKLYIAKPQWQVKYLMDNSELSRGMKEASSLFTAIGDSTYSTKASSEHSELDTAIESSFWNPAKNEYRWAIAGLVPNEVIYNPDYSKCYADSQANVWVNTFSTTVGASRKTQLAQKFDSDSKDIIDSGKAKCKWNPIVATGMINAGQTTIAKDYNNYGLSVARSGVLGGIYTAGHDGMFLVNKYKLLGQSLFF
jgi:hypothetical protein